MSGLCAGTPGRHWEQTVSDLSGTHIAQRGQWTSTIHTTKSLSGNIIITYFYQRVFLVAFNYDKGKEGIFLCFLADTYTCPILGSMVPLFWISCNVSSGFQSQSEFCPTHFFAEANIMQVPWDPPLAPHLPTFWWPASQLVAYLHAHFHSGRMLSLNGFQWTITRTEGERATVVPQCTGIELK